MKGTIALGLAFLIYPFVFSNAFYLDIGVALLLAAISASAWNIVGGYAGQVSVGHCMFFGAGAYLPLLFYHHWQLPPLLGVPAGILVSLALAVIVGMPTFRLTGHYFSMATIAVAELIRLVIGTWDFVSAAIGLQRSAAPARSMVRWSARLSSFRCRPRPTPGSAAAARASPTFSTAGSS